jgi:hypothetical protein
MPSTDDVGRISNLYRGLREIRTAVRVLEGGGRIVGMSIAPARDEGTPLVPTVRVTTEYMEYPAPMIQAILGYMAARRTEIEQQLTELGLTIDPEQEPPAEPEAMRPRPPNTPVWPPGSTTPPAPPQQEGPAPLTPRSRQPSPPQPAPRQASRPPIRPPGARPPR